MRKTMMLVLGAGLVATAALQLPTATLAAEWGMIRPEINNEVIRAGIKVPDIRKQGKEAPDVRNKKRRRGIIAI